MRTLATVAALLLATSAGAAPSPVEIREGLAYGPDPEDVLDICLPATPGVGRAAVIVIHGGGWDGGSRNTVRGWCRAAAEAGMVGAAIDYRLATGPRGKWPAALEDSQLALRWLRRSAPGFGIDPHRICALGFSAGGQLAVFLATLRETYAGDRSALLSWIPSGIACAVTNFGPVNLAADKALAGAPRKLAQSDDPEVRAAVAQDASPLFRIGPETVPIMIVQGDADRLVPPAQAAALAEALARAGVPAEQISYHGGHGFEGLTGAEIGALMAREITYVAAAKPRP